MHAGFIWLTLGRGREPDGMQRAGSKAHVQLLMGLALFVNLCTPGGGTVLVPAAKVLLVRCHSAARQAACCVRLCILAEL